MLDRGGFEILIVAAGAELVTKGNSIHLLRSLINVNEVSNHLKNIAWSAKYFWPHIFYY